MSNILDFTSDVLFLNKVHFSEKECNQIHEECLRNKKSKNANFTLHPKLLETDSECSSVPVSPKMKCKYTEFEFVQEVTEKITKPKDNQTNTITNNVKIQNINPKTVQNFEKKFKFTTERILKVLNDIRKIIETGVPLPDGEEDFQRKSKRLQEFSSRFSRIYVYPLIRQMNDLSASEKINSDCINQKLLNGQQLICQALQAYSAHLPTSVANFAFDKLDALLKQAIYLCDLYELLKNDSNSETWEFINAMKTHIEGLSETMNTITLNNNKKEIMKQQKHLQQPKTNPKTRTKTKLSMYNQNILPNNTNIKKKFNIKSKYKTAGFKHRPPIPKQESKEIKIWYKNTSSSLKNSPKISEDRGSNEIKTMIEMEGELQAPPNTSKENIPFEKCRSEIVQVTCSNSKINEPQIINTGAKNVGLICIYDEKEVVEDKEDVKQCVDNKIQTDNKQCRSKKCGSNIKISRVPKTGRTLTLLSKEHAINVIQYKLSYNQFHKLNPMYRKSAYIQPWILMGRISDDIFDGTLKSVINELEVNSLLENLYKSEFQY